MSYLCRFRVEYVTVKSQGQSLDACCLYSVSMSMIYKKGICIFIKFTILIAKNVPKFRDYFIIVFNTFVNLKIPRIDLAAESLPSQLLQCACFRFHCISSTVRSI